MHLPNGDGAMHYGEVSRKNMDDAMPSDRASKLQRIDQYMKRPEQGNNRTMNKNQVEISLPQDRPWDEVLDTVLTAWTILVQRYQRDLFHQFTWGVRDAGNDSAACIPTAKLDLPNQSTAKSLTAHISSARTRDYTINAGSKLFLNDGTSAEVCTTLQLTKASLTVDSGPSKYRSASVKAP
jgi:hypothetical protein